jgi:LysR family transcriptional activator of nhaA
MRWLNYHHFYYFWMVAREGGIQPAAKLLRLTHPTVSAQIRQFEEALGEDLFDRSGRRLSLTAVGRMAYKYADEIFRLGEEFMDSVQESGAPQTLPLVVGATGAIPKVVVRRLLAPALQMDPRVRLVCREDEHDRLLSLLAIHELDVVLSDAPLSPSSGVKAFNHLLGESGMTFFAAPRAMPSLSGPFPECLDGAPLLAPLPNSSMGRALRQWFDELGIRPDIVAEVQDSALIKALGQDGVGAFCMPSAVEDEVVRQFHVKTVGRTEEIKERYYAISPERRLRNPAVVAISRGARSTIFAD